MEKWGCSTFVHCLHSHDHIQSRKCINKETQSPFAGSPGSITLRIQSQNWKRKKAIRKEIPGLARDGQ
ncbi:hypothetical protein CIPAW_07G124500 [Carya illinoinensis]|uniref:Uncharacterized protein n=1 Tax=Carya illinoinensis TaxID=32201 RepID=A0A8T1PU71_CARIL|nr:hypothetical protein CIPAW_07G124500 [Carya illinoinensis]